MNRLEFRKCFRAAFPTINVDPAASVFTEITKEYSINDIPSLTSEEIKTICYIYPHKKGNEVVNIDVSTIKSYSTLTLKCLKVMGADTCELEDEIKEYDYFKQEYKKKYSRDNLLRTYHTVYIPLKRKFTFEALKSGLVPIEEFITWVEQTYSKFSYILLENILTLMEADMKYITYIKRYTVTKDILELNKQFNDKYSHLSRKTFETYMNTFNALQYQINDLTIEEALKYCKHDTNPNMFILGKIDILEFIGVSAEKIQSIREQAERKNKQYEWALYIRTNVLQCKRNTSLIIDIDNAFNGIEDNIGKMSIDDITHVYSGLEDKVSASKIIKHFLSPDRFKQFEMCLTYKEKEITKLEEFKSFSPWRKALAEYIENKLIIEIKKSSYKDSVVKKTSYRMISCLNLINDFVSLRMGSYEDSIKWFLHSCNYDMVEEFLIFFAEKQNVDNTRVKSSVDCHHASRAVSLALRLFKLLKDKISCYTEIKGITPSQITAHVENLRQPADVNKRRTYTDEEFERIFKEVKDDTKLTLLFTLFREVALRSGAICNLQFKHIVDQYNTPIHSCSVMEKGKKQRTFITSPNLKQKILKHVSRQENLNRDHYVFSHNPLKPGSSTTLLACVKRIASLAGITDVDVYPHAFRHTMVGKLMKEGNSAELVSKYIGHSSVDTTVKYYWVNTIEDLANQIKNPFIPKPTKEELEEEEQDEIIRLQRKFDSAMEIIYIYNEVLSNGLKSGLTLEEYSDAILNEIPDLDKLIRRIDSIATQSTGSSREEEIEI
jgi:integrase